jgi:putative ABC transport system permease protein
VRALDRKLLRELVTMKGQVLSIALVIAAGLGAFVSLGGNWYALTEARDRYYERFGFGDVFASLERAPDSREERLRSLRGVRSLATRIVEPATMVIERLPLPVRTRLVSLPRADHEHLDVVDLRSGRWPESASEALLFEAFAERNGIAIGTHVEIVIHDTRQRLRVTGLAASPAEIFPMPTGEVAPDPERFAVLWMRRDDLAGATGKLGSFNDVVVRLDRSLPDAERAVIEALDRELEPFGALGAFGRDRHPSHLVLEGELSQLRTISLFVPGLFFGVATLLVQIVMTRLVELQRQAVATLKALGYPDSRIAGHFLTFAAVVGLLGSVLGLLVGARLGSALTELYARFFRIPGLAFALPEGAVALAVGSSLSSTLVGAFGAVRRIAALPPAVAMHVAPPAMQRRSFLDTARARRWVVPAVTLVLRETLRRPARAALGVAAMAAAVGLLVVGRWFGDATAALMDIQFDRVMTEDLTLMFDRPVALRELGWLRHLPGVLRVEPLRGVAVRVRRDGRQRDAVVWGVETGGLRHVIDRDGAPIALPPSGVVVSDALADALDVAVGDTVELEWREGDRARVVTRVTGIVADLVGLQAYTAPGHLAELRREVPSASLALLRIDPSQLTRINRQLSRLPRLASATTRVDLVERFRRQTGEMMGTFTLVVTMFAVTMALGVVHNQARVALSTRARELATMRVLGFTRREATSVLLVELALHVLLALPLGLWLGRRMAVALASTVDPERFRMPLVVAPETTTFAIGLTLLAAGLAAVTSSRRLARMPLVHVLEAGE